MKSQWDQNNYICFFLVIRIFNLEGGKKPKFNKNWFISFLKTTFFSLFLSECKLFSSDSPGETPCETEGSQVFAAQAGLQPLQHHHCSRAPGRALHSDLSPQQQLLLSVVQSPLKIVGISALTLGSNAPKYQHYVQARRYRKNIAGEKKKSFSLLFSFTHRRCAC